MNKATAIETVKLLKSIMAYSDVSKMLNTFISAFEENSIKNPDGHYYLYGNFNIGGTVSGRLSSCLVGESLVQCATGLKQIKDVNITDTVPTHTGAMCKVKNVFDNGLAPVYKITLSSGKSLICTANHRLLTNNGFKSLEELYESTKYIGHGFTGINHTSHSSISERVFIGTSRTDTWTGIPDSNSNKFSIIHRGTKEKKNIYKGSNSKSTRKVSSTTNFKRLCKYHRTVHRGIGKNLQDTPSNCLQIHSRKFRGYRVSKGILAKKVLPQNIISISSWCIKNERGNARWARLRLNTNTFVDAKRANIYLRTSSNIAKKHIYGKITSRFCNTSCKHGQDRQSPRQFSTTNPCSSHIFTCKFSEYIQQVDYVGIRRVYDLEVETDHCYIANGIYVHNSHPNLTNLPSNSSLSKHIKKCFKAASGRIMAGADMSSLEDRISALTTKDPNKMRVYEDGYDGHSLRAFSYFRNQLVGIVDTVDSINSIATLYPKQRQDSKAPTFLLTYGGTYHGLMNNVGLTKESALAIEANYHELYKVSDEWVATKLEEATRVGYVTVAFGLRVRTPILGQTLLNTKITPYEASAESRTAGNALGQSYCLLNNRAAIEFFERLLVSEYAHDIKIIALIHDAIYLDFPATLGCTEWVNKNLIECMEWQALPEIQHPIVKLGGSLELFPTWADSISIPNGASRSKIHKLCVGKNII